MPRGESGCISARDCYVLDMRATLALAVLAGLSVVAGSVAASPRTVPTTVVLVIDRSGSMQGPRLEAVKQAALAVYDALSPGDQLAVVAFDSEAQVFAPLQKIGADRKAFQEAIARLRAGGGTNYLPGLQAAYDLTRGARTANQHLILLSDGEAPYDGITALVDDGAKRGVTISTIGFGDADRALLSLISDRGHGRLYMVTDVSTIPRVITREALDARVAH
jgi:Mg-chelatase subunit ChlD